MTRWKRMKSPDEVRQAVLDQVGPDPTVAEVLAFADEQAWQHSDLVDGVVYCSTPARGRWPWISAKWLIEFRFDGGRLSQLTVRRGLTGP